MGLVSRIYDFVNGTLADGDQVDADINTLYSEINGNLDNTNIKPAAGIAQSKINNLSADLAGKLPKSAGIGEAISGELQIERVTPRLRLKGEEGSAKEWALTEDAGKVYFQENTGTEATPTWTNRFTVPSTDAGVLPHIGRFYENLVMTVFDATSVSITATQATVFNSNGGQVRLASVNVTDVDTGGSGANGLDTGAIADGYYWVWLIYNGVTTAGLISLSPTSPTMPSGYTHKLLLGPINRVAGSLLLSTQRDNVVSYDDAVKVVDNAGGQTTVSTGIDEAVPTIRVAKVGGKILNNSGSNRTVFLSSTTMSNSLVEDNVEAQFQSGMIASRCVSFVLPIKEAQTMYLQTDNAAANVDIWISWYEIQT